MADDFQRVMYYEDIAELMGCTVKTVREEYAKARQVRRLKSPQDDPYLARSYRMPEPDGRNRQSPWWYASTINRWLDERKQAKARPTGKRRAPEHSIASEAVRSGLV